MARADHELILSTYGRAFFRCTLPSDATFTYLDHTSLPTGVLNDKIHLAYQLADTRIVDDYEGHPITQDTEGQPTAQLTGYLAPTRSACSRVSAAAL